MTDDIVARLRNWWEGNTTDLYEAADEIERLRAALRRIGDLLSHETYDEPCLERFCGELARAALNKDKTDD